MLNPPLTLQLQHQQSDGDEGAGGQHRAEKGHAGWCWGTREDSAHTSTLFTSNQHGGEVPGHTIRLGSHASIWVVAVIGYKLCVAPWLCNNNIYFNQQNFELLVQLHWEFFGTLYNIERSIFFSKSYLISKNVIPWMSWEISGTFFRYGLSLAQVGLVIFLSKYCINLTKSIRFITILPGFTIKLKNINYLGCYIVINS